MERWFAAFRANGDPRPLARVFDRAAPELWRVAVHLTRDRHAAEDAVQSTFLAAIEAKADWDATRPLLPWLLGLLANRVREARRKDARAPDPERVATPGGERDPVELALATELDGALRTALAGIAEPYRSTLEQHLVHGLSAHEIAMRDALAAGTVRMRLHRGLDQLRHKLPKGVVAGGVGAALLSGQAMAAMRTTILNAAGNARTTAATASSPFVTSKGKLVGIVAASVLSIVLAVVVSTRGANGLEPPSGVASDRLASEAAPRTSGSSTEPDARSGGTRDAVADGGSEAPADRIAAPATTGELRVVVRNQEDARPIAGVEMVVLAGVAAKTSLSEAEDAGLPQSVVGPWTGTTDEDGVVSFELPAGPARIEITSPLPRTERVEITAGRTEAHTVLLPLLLAGEVHVVDGSGRPVAGASIVTRDPSNDDGVDEEAGVTDANGTWRTSLRRHLLVRALAAGASSRAASLTRESRTVTLRLDAAGAAVTGTVRDATGKPIAAAGVAIEPLVGGQGEACRTLRTDERGRYTFDRLRPGRHTILAWRGSGDRRQFQRAEVDVPANDPAVADLTIGGLPRLVVELTRPDGTPCVRPMVIVSARRQHMHCVRIHRTETADDQGRLVIEGLPAGDYDMSAMVSFGTGQLDEAITLREGEALWLRRTLGGASWVEVRTTDERGAPLVGMRLSLHQTHPADGERDWLWGDSKIVATDGDGVARFEQQEDVPLWVTVRAPAGGSSLPIATREVHRQTRTTIALTSAELAQRVVRGRVTTRDGRAVTGHEAILVRTATPSAPLRDRMTVDIAPDGSFEFVGVPAQTYDLLVIEEEVGPAAVRRGVVVPAAHDVDIGVVLAERFDLRCHLLHGDGVAVEQPRILVRLSDNYPFTAWNHRLFEGGVELRGLPTGGCEMLVLSTNGAPQRTTAPSAASGPLTIRIAPAAVVAMRVEHPPAKYSRGRLTVHRGGRPWVLEEDVDAAAGHRLGLPPGSYRLEFANGTASWSAEVAVGTEPVEVVLRKG